MFDGKVSVVITERRAQRAAAQAKMNDDKAIIKVKELVDKMSERLRAIAFIDILNPINSIAIAIAKYLRY